MGGNSRFPGLTDAIRMFVLDEVQVRTNMANTITAIKRIVGRKFNEEGVQAELENHAFFNAVQMPNGEVGVEVSGASK